MLPCACGEKVRCVFVSNVPKSLSSSVSKYNSAIAITLKAFGGEHPRDTQAQAGDLAGNRDASEIRHTDQFATIIAFAASINLWS
jgi:hypothetical protein